MTTATRERERIPLGQAQVLAGKALEELRPFCERIEVAGSIRRRVEAVKDAELVCIPKTRTDLFGNPIGDELTDSLAGEVMRERPRWRKRAGVDGRTVFGRQNKFLEYDGFAMDVFSTPAQRWGMTFFVRTGPKEFVRAAMARFQQLGTPGHAYGGVTIGEGQRPCPDEADVFRLLAWGWVDPEARA